MASNHPQERLVVTAAAFTDTGQVRKHNEDYVAYHIPKEESAEEPCGALLVVCDGVGGGAAGEIASEHAVRRILNDYYSSVGQPSPPPDSLHSPESGTSQPGICGDPELARLLSAIQQANAEIFQRNAGEPDARRMTTTVVAAALVESRARVAHAGDSRAYLVRGGQINQLTRDHSWVAEMVRSGDLTPQEAEAHPWRNRITRALGMKENLDLDSQTVELKAGDKLVLCSDGLTRHVSDAEILETVNRQPLRQAGQELIGLANKRGGADNISVIVAELSARESRSPAVQPLNRAPGGEDKTQGLPGPRPRSRPMWPLYAAGGVIIVALLAIGLIFALRTMTRPPSATPPPAATSALPAAPAAAPETATETGIVPTGTSTATETPPPPTSTTKPSATATLAATATLTRTLSPTAALTPTVAPGITPTTVAGGDSVWRQWVSRALTRVAMRQLPVPRRP